MIDIKLNMKIVPKQRPRVTRRGTFMPKAYVEQRKLLQARFRPFKKLEGELEMDCLFIFKKSKTNHLNKMSMPLGDCDNLIGSIMDAGEGVLYENDRQIVSIKAKKMWGTDDIVFINIKEAVI